LDIQYSMLLNIRFRDLRMFARDLLRRLGGPIYAHSVRGVKGSIVDSEVGTLHLSTEDEEKPKRNQKQNSFARNLKEELNPHENLGPVDGAKRERSLNMVYLLGRVGNNPVMRGSSEKPVTVFSLATNTMWRTPNPGPGEEEWTHRTDWHNVAVFKKGLRDYAYDVVGKGARIHLQGRILYGEVTDTAGIRRQTTTIVADDIILINTPTTK